MSEILGALLPPVGVLVLFIIVIRGLVGADRRERAARQRIEHEIRTRHDPPQEDG